MRNKSYASRLLLVFSLLLTLLACRQTPSGVGEDATYWVAVNGSDSNPGTKSQPFKTIQKGIDILQAGETLIIKEGRYQELLHVSADKSGNETVGSTLICSEDGAVVIIDGGGKQDEYVIYLENVEYITIQGLTLTNAGAALCCETTNEGKKEGESYRNIRIVGNRAFGLDGAAAIIEVAGRNNKAPIVDLLVTDNIIEDNRSFWSENLTLAGYIDGFEISGNFIRNGNNIAIDMVGFYPWDAPLLLAGNSMKVRHANNYVRNGKCFNNFIFGQNTSNNNAYWSAFWDEEDIDDELDFGGQYDRCCGGIYVDGGQNIEIYQNFIFDCDIGIEVATEAVSQIYGDFSVSGVKVHDNIIASSQGWTGICFGGYDGNLGYTFDCEIYNNIIYDCAIAFGVQKSFNNVIYNNIIVGGEGAIDFMSEIWTKSKDGFDAKALRNLPGANKFGNNLWFNAEEAENWDAGLQQMKKVAVEQFNRQILTKDQPLTDPKNGDFQVKAEYAAYGTDFSSWDLWTHGQAVLSLYREFLEAAIEREQAVAYLQATEFSFTEIKDKQNLNDFLTEQLQQAGFKNSKVTKVLQTGAGLNAKYADSAGIVALFSEFFDERFSTFIQTNKSENGTIDRTKLATSSQKKFVYLVEVVTYFNNDYYSKATTQSGVYLVK